VDEKEVVVPIIFILFESLAYMTIEMDLTAEIPKIKTFTFSTLDDSLMGDNKKDSVLL